MYITASNINYIYSILEYFKYLDKFKIRLICDKICYIIL